jgi:hypothetical protein
MTLSAQNRMMLPKEIIVQAVSIREMVIYQREASKVTWRPSPGRHLQYVIVHNEEIIGLIALASPVMNMRARDMFLGLPSHDMRRKGLELRHYMDLSVCVGIQPCAWHWNLGKLSAMIAPTFSDDYEKKYGQKLKGIITTSVWGRSSQYNRIYKQIGFSSGMGSEHIPENELVRMRNELKKIGWKTNWKHSRMAVIQDYRKLIRGAISEGNRAVKHGHKRGIYFHKTVDYDWRKAIFIWYDRWGLPRYNRTVNLTPPYTDGISGGRESTEERERQGTQRQLFY